MEGEGKPVRQRRPTPVASDPPRLEKNADTYPVLEELTEDTEEDFSSSETSGSESPENAETSGKEEPGVIKNSNENSSNNKSILLGVVIILIAILIHSNFQWPPLSHDQKVALKIKFKDMTEKYKKQPYETWHLLKHEMLSSEPSIITLLYLDKNVAECLANQLADLALEANNTRKVIKLRSSQLAKNNQHLVEKYKPELEKNGVMIIFDIGQLSGQQALGLHSFSDNLNPLVKKTVIIFTLQDDGSMMREKPNKRATSILEKLWKGVPEELVAPLVTRLVNSVVEIRPEPNFYCAN